MHEKIDKLLDQYVAALEFVVSLFPSPYRPTVRWILSPLYSEIKHFRELNQSGGDPDRLRDFAEVFSSLDKYIVSVCTSLTNDDDNNNRLKALSNPEVWQDSPADVAYASELSTLLENLQHASDYADSIAQALRREATISDQYYTSLDWSILSFGVSVASLVAGIASAPATMTTSAWVAILVSTVGVAIGGIELINVINVCPTTIDNICEGEFPQPGFARTR